MAGPVVYRRIFPNRFFILFMKTPNTSIYIGCLLMTTLLCIAGSSAAAEKSQQEIADELGALTLGYSVETDDDGNVIKIGFSHHGGRFDREGKEDLPGITDEAVQKLAAFPKLEAVFFEHQKISNEGYMFLKNLPNLIDVRMHGVSHKQWTGEDGDAVATADHALVVNEFQKPLKILQLKHNFGVPGSGVMAQLEPQPELEFLELDTNFAQSDAVEFIKAAPKLRNLQLHRTTINDAELQEILAALPELEVLEVRPTGSVDSGEPITGKSLRGLQGHENLRQLHTSVNWGEIPFEDGLEHLVGIESLEYVELKSNNPKLTPESPQVRKLHEARPDLIIDVRGGTLGPRDEDRQYHRDEDYRWGVTS